METKTEIAIIDHKEFGIEETKANLILARFEPLQDKMQELESEYTEVLALDINDPMTELKAKELGKKYMKIRTSRASIHKEEKAFFLNAGRFVDKLKKEFDKSTIHHEEELEKIEKYHANLEAERIKNLANQRITKLAEFEFNGSDLNLGTMDDNVWISFLSGTEMAFKAKKEEEKRLVAEKLEREKAEEIERKRIAEENAKLKAEAELKTKIRSERNAELRPYIIFIRDYNKMLDLNEVDYKNELEEIKIAAKQHYEYEAKEKAISDAKLKGEREANEKLKAELQAKQDAERKAEAEKQAELKAKLEAEKKAEKKAAKAPDKIKFQKAISELSLQLQSNDFTTQNIAISINTKLEGFKKWAFEQIETI